MARSYYSLADVEQYIRASAARRGIDPNIAVRVARSEGLAPNTWQSRVMRNGKQETSYGPFQLLVGGGLGDKFKAQTGMDPSDPASVYKQVDFALDHAKGNGWGDWYGAAKVGVGKWSGIGKGGAPAPQGLLTSDMPPPSLSGVGSPTAPQPPQAPNVPQPMTGDMWAGMRDTAPMAPAQDTGGGGGLGGLGSLGMSLLASAQQQPQPLPPPAEVVRPQQYNGIPMPLSLMFPQRRMA